MLAQRSPELQRAYEELENLSQDRLTKERYESILKAKRDEISRLKGAERKGEQNGIEKGVQQEKLEIAQKMLNRNFPISEISEMTGLSEESIRAIQ